MIIFVLLVFFRYLVEAVKLLEEQTGAADGNKTNIIKQNPAHTNHTHTCMPAPWPTKPAPFKIKRLQCIS